MFCCRVGRVNACSGQELRATGACIYCSNGSIHALVQPTRASNHLKPSQPVSTCIVSHPPIRELPIRDTPQTLYDPLAHHSNPLYQFANVASNAYAQARQSSSRASPCLLFEHLGLCKYMLDMVSPGEGALITV